MKLRSLCAAVGLALAFVFAVRAQEPAATATAAEPELSPVLTDLKALVDRISTKIKGGAKDPSEFADEVATFDQLLAKYKDDTSEDAVRIAYMQATFTLQVMQDISKAREQLNALQAKYPDSEGAKAAGRLLIGLDRMEAANEAKTSIIGQPAPELNFIWSSKDGLKQLSDLKGRVVVLDFWATWCGPCLASFSKVRKHVEHFKDVPVTFLGVTSIQGFVANMGPRIDTKDDPEKEMGLMPEFMKKREMTWDVAFSEENVFNPDYGISGIPYVAIVDPNGNVRYAGIHPGDDSADIDGKITGLLKEFNLPTPN